MLGLALGTVGRCLSDDWEPAGRRTVRGAASHVIDRTERPMLAAYVRSEQYVDRSLVLSGGFGHGG